MLIATALTAVAVLAAFYLRKAWRYIWKETDDITGIFDLPEVDDPRDHH